MKPAAGISRSPRTWPGTALAIGWCPLVLFALAAIVRAEETARATVPEESKIVRLRPFSVRESRLGTVGIEFAPIGADYGDGEWAIDTVTVIDVPPDSPGEKAGLRKGDQLLRLNQQVIRGLTVADFGDLIRLESEKGDLTWKVSRAVSRVTFYTVFNGRGDRHAGVVKTPEPVPEKPAPPAEAVPERIERLGPYAVQETFSTAIDVVFVMKRQTLFAELDDPIEEAKVVDVQGDVPPRARKLRPGDRLLALNGIPIQGMSLRELGARVAEDRRKGLEWDVRRGLETITVRYDGRWIHPLPGLAVAKLR